MRDRRYTTYPALNSLTDHAETELVGAGDVVLIAVGSLPDGYRVGDRLRAPLDRIFDFVVFDDSGAACLNTERARFAVDKQMFADCSSNCPMAGTNGYRRTSAP